MKEFDLLDYIHRKCVEALKTQIQHCERQIAEIEKCCPEPEESIRDTMKTLLWGSANASADIEAALNAMQRERKGEF